MPALVQTIRPSATWASGVTDDHAPKNMLDITKRFEDNMLDAAVLRRFALAENAAHLVPRSPFYSRIKIVPSEIAGVDISTLDDDARAELRAEDRAAVEPKEGVR